MNKILINTPNIYAHGGVAFFYLALKDKFTTSATYNTIGGNSGKRFALFFVFYDYIIFIKKIITLKPLLIHLNPSLNIKSILRDSIFLLISKIFRKKVLIYFYGWDLELEKKIDSSKILRFIIKTALNFSNTICVQSQNYVDKIREWGFQKIIHLESGVVSDESLIDFDIKKKDYTGTLLFMARIEKSKGIYILLDAFKKLSNLSLLIAGDGGILEEVKSYVSNNKIDGVKFLGYITDIQKSEVLRKSSIYILPTTHGEGMPSSVLEALAFGCAIITRPVGGIKDFIKDKKMGVLTESLDSNDYFSIIKDMISDKNRLREISEFNHSYAVDNFLASKVATRLDNIYNETLLYNKIQ